MTRPIWLIPSTSSPLNGSIWTSFTRAPACLRASYALAIVSSYHHVSADNFGKQKGEGEEEEGKEERLKTRGLPVAGAYLLLIHFRIGHCHDGWQVPLLRIQDSNANPIKGARNFRSITAIGLSVLTWIHENIH